MSCDLFYLSELWVNLTTELFAQSVFISHKHQTEQTVTVVTEMQVLCVCVAAELDLFVFFSSSCQIVIKPLNKHGCFSQDENFFFTPLDALILILCHVEQICIRVSTCIFPLTFVAPPLKSTLCSD